VNRSERNIRVAQATVCGHRDVPSRVPTSPFRAGQLMASVQDGRSENLAIRTSGGRPHVV
jgi:hypothetical protein